MANSNEITLKQVRFVAEKLRDEDKVVTVRSVRAVLQRGSDATIAPYLKLIKTEWADGESFDSMDLSARLKSALAAKLDRYRTNIETIERNKAEQTEKLFNEVCDTSAHLERRIVSLENELSASKSCIHDLEMDMARSEERLEAIKKSTSDLASERSEILRERNSYATKLVNLQARLDLAERMVASEQKKFADSQRRFSECESRKAEAVQKAALAEQRAEHSKSVSERLERELAKMEKEKQVLLARSWGGNG